MLPHARVKDVRANDIDTGHVETEERGSAAKCR
jgi:hypothetical protein